MGQLGLFGLTAPEEYGGADGDFTSLCVAIEEIGRVDQSMGITLEAAVGLGINPILTYGTDEQKQTWLPDLVSGRTLAGFGLTEPGCRLRRRGHADEGRAGRGRVGHQRRQAVHHQLRLRHHQRGHGDRPDRRRRRRAPRDLQRSSSRRTRPASPPRRPTTSSAGTPPTPTRCPSRTCACPRRTCSASVAAAYAQFLATLDDGRVAIAALAVGCIQACLDMSLAVRRRAADFRRADRPQAGPGVPDRRPRGDAPRRPPADLQGGGDEGRRTPR